MTGRKNTEFQVGTVIQLWDDCRGAVVWVEGSDTPLSEFRECLELGVGLVVVSTAAGAIHYPDLCDNDLATILGQIPINSLRNLTEAEVRELLESNDSFDQPINDSDE